MTLQQALRLQANATLRARMKGYTNAWWHKTHCPNCSVNKPHDGLQGLFSSLRARGIEVEDVSAVHVVGEKPTGSTH